MLSSEYFSAISNKKTAKANNTFIPNEIFSPVSGGTKKTDKPSDVTIQHGMTIFRTKNRGLLCNENDEILFWKLKQPDTCVGCNTVS